MRTIRDFMKVISEGIVNEEMPGERNGPGDIPTIREAYGMINDVIDTLEDNESVFANHFGRDEFENFLAAAYALGVVKGSPAYKEI